MIPKPSAKIRKAFGPVLDEDNYNWLDREHPQYLAIIERFVFDPDITSENLGNTLSTLASENRTAFVQACQGTLRHLRRINNVG